MFPTSTVAQLIQTTLHLDVRAYDRQAQLVVAVNNPAVTPPHRPAFPDLRTLTKCTRFTDVWQLSYFLIPQSAIVWVVGPFTTTALTSQLIASVLSRNQATISDRHQFAQFYNTLPILSQHEVQTTGTLLVNLLAHPLRIPAWQTLTTPQTAPAPAALPFKRPTTTAHHYQIEANLMATIRTGDTDKITDYFAPMTAMLDFFQNRLANRPLRSCQDMCLVSNTIDRIAARQGGVHPGDLDSLSEKFALLIERQRSIVGLKRLIVAMLTEYTQLVHDRSTAGYSPLIQRAVAAIWQHLGDSFKVASLAQWLQTSPSYLSRRFKQETTQTLTEFITAQRLASAKTYLLNTTTPITAIALLVGFSDPTTFTKRFKQVTHQTPSEYRRHPRS
ncbi:helix-turn-helix transcriptional regulator [Levilactobacillus suantsaii]|uniref:Helix-turn-helix domain-containing protein n=1 Tax=Levilactobacillus suantsaii TaxID=2292255 RepID=A0A4V1LFP6_9LACO|nr:AraC family transcriptional regulator [Levilactobacillus suantsaii]QMU07090.1 helix-turn-helix domain-containing protein [Levilactobacillus suantsaii]RXI80135.1 helix-turn-helix domain-containing protein [Levilactobacillus suantsaii]